MTDEEILALLPPVSIGQRTDRREPATAGHVLRGRGATWARIGAALQVAKAVCLGAVLRRGVARSPADGGR